MPSFLAQQSLFRAYDIRGSHRYFTDEFTQALGQAFACLYHSQSYQQSAPHSTDLTQPRPTVVIGYDMRLGSEAIAATLTSTLSQYGLSVIELGLITTPMMAFWASRYQGHGIVVTASHSAKDILGIKWLVDNHSPSCTEIQALYQHLTATQCPTKNQTRSICQYVTHVTPERPNDIWPVADESGTTKPSERLPNVTNAYIASIEQVLSQLSDHHSHSHHDDKHNNNHDYKHDRKARLEHGTSIHSAVANSGTIGHAAMRRNTPTSRKAPIKSDLVVVIDCMNGATGIIAQRLFARFCQRVIMRNETPDGNLPFGNPDPTEPNRLTDLQQTVIAHQADIGLAFDGDGDRLMIIDDTGTVVTPDHLLYLLARVAVEDCPKPPDHTPSPSQILFDIKCTHHLPMLLSELGATPVMSKTGSSFMRRQIQHSKGNIVFAGELSGHFIFNDGRFIAYDDAMYAALRLLHWLASPSSDTHDKQSLSSLIQRLPAMISTADHYLPIPPAPSTDCSFMAQLTRVCHHLCTVTEASTYAHAVGFVSYDSTVDKLHADSCVSADCTCGAIKSGMALEQVKDLLPPGTRLSCLDGVRLDFAHGFGVLRPSNTSHSLTVRFAGDSMEDLKSIQRTFAGLCRPLNKKLAAQIIAIAAEQSTQP